MLLTAACIWYQRHTLLWFHLLLFSVSVFVLDSPDTWLPRSAWEHYRRMLRFAPLADFLKVLLITTWSPSSALLAEIRIIIPLRCSWRKIRYDLIHSYKGSLRTKTDTAYRIQNHPFLRFFWNWRCFFLLYPVLLPSVLALMLSRYYPWERTCNADMWFSMYMQGRFFPLTYT